MKGAICVAGAGQALLSHHLGDLDEPLSWAQAVQAERDYSALFDHNPALITCDSHPEYRTTQHAEAQAERLGVPLLRVQHHHAHIAAVMAENGWPSDGGKVLGVAMDGLGWGDDGTIWGGEFLLCDYAGFTRVGSLRPVALPGGEAAQREPWRNLWAHLIAAGLDPAPLLPGKPLATLAAMVAKGLNAPLCSSAGRLFDAVAAACDLTQDRLSFEGEAAMALEAAAHGHKHAPPYPFDWTEPVLDAAPMWRALLVDRASGASAGLIAARFHAGFATALRCAAEALADKTGAAVIAVGGGVFQNATLLAHCAEGWRYPVLLPSLVPAGDGGLALGQAVIAMMQHSRADG